MKALVNFLALGVLCALIWFGGEHLGISVKIRVALILGALAFWLLLFVWQRLQAVRTARLIEQRLREQAIDQIANSRPAERDQLEDLERRMKDAISALKATKLGTSALAELPWYIIIGPPGSGKSTALQASGLEFPRMGQGLNGIQGVGGTRNCEWWFTSEGILLDTAGRYTSVAEDRAEWLGFLGMIKRSRARKPINGAIVALSVVDLIQCTEEQLVAHSNSVRERLDELSKELEQVFPVYVMFTKCDLLSGFVDTFESLGRSEREQVWGFTFPYDPLSSDRYRQIFQRECAGLIERLSRRRLELLASEKPAAVAQRIYSFPMQLGAATDKLSRFIERTFLENKFREQPILRGFYFTSGTQEGRPIDQVLGALRSAFGQAAPEAPAPPPAEKKSYFLTNLFRKIIFADKNLARSLASAERRRRIMHFGAMVGCVAASVVALVLLSISFFGNRALTARVASGVNALKAVKADAGTPLAARLEALDELRPELEELWRYDIGWAPISLRWGLYQGNSITPPARELYFAELHKTLLGPCLQGIEAELAAAAAPDADPSKLKVEYGLGHEQLYYQALYELLRVYLILGGKLGDGSERDRVDVKDQLRARNRWLRGLKVGPGDKPSGKEVDLALGQLDFLVTQLSRATQWGPKLDDDLATRVRKKLEANYWVSQSYAQIRDTMSSEAGTESAESLFGPAAALFQTPDPVSKLFTKNQWDEKISRAIGEKSKLLAQQYAEMKTPKAEADIEKELRGYFELEGRQRWIKFMDDLHIAPMGDMDGVAKRLELLGSPQSPLPKLMKEVWIRQHVLDADIEAAKLKDRPREKAKPDEQVRSWQDQAQDAFLTLARAFAEAAKRPKSDRIYALAEKDLGMGLRELDKLQATFKEVRSRLLDDIALQIPVQQETYLRRFVREVLDRAREGIQNEALTEANARWESTVYSLWRDRLAGKYPFVKEAGVDAPLPEIATLFNPVDGSVWRVERAVKALQAYEIGDAGLTTGGLKFQRYVESVKKLKDALFAGAGGPNVNVAMKVKLTKRTGVRNLRLAIGEDAFRESDLPPGQRKELIWGMQPGAKLSIHALQQEEWAHKDFSASPWGLLRLLDAGKLDREQSSGRSFRYTWEFELPGGNRQADVELEVVREEAKPVLDRTLFENLETPPERVEQ